MEQWILAVGLLGLAIALAYLCGGGFSMLACYSVCV